MKILKNKTYNALVAEIKSLEDMYTQDTYSLKEHNQDLELELEYIKNELCFILKQPMKKEKIINRIQELVSK